MARVREEPVEKGWRGARWVVAAALLTLTLTTAGPSYQDVYSRESRADAAIKAAITLFERGELEDALEEANDPARAGSAYARYLMGRILAQMGDAARANANYRAALHAEPWTFTRGPKPPTWRRVPEAEILEALARMEPGPSGPGMTMEGSGLGVCDRPPGDGGSRGSLLIQPDGRIVVGGDFSCYNGEDAFGLLRILPDGRPDRLFQAALGVGPATGREGTQVGLVHGLALQADGKLLVGGRFETLGGRPVRGLARLEPDGRVDDAFIAVLGQKFSEVTALAVDRLQRVVVAGRAPEVRLGTAVRADCLLVRLLPDGAPDSTFQAAVEGKHRCVDSLTLDPDGRIVVSGHGLVARLFPDGGMDEAFDLRLPLDIASSDVVTALQPDGKILIGALTSQGPGQRWTPKHERSWRAIRVLPQGKVDTTFAMEPISRFQGRALLSLVDGGILVAGRTAGRLPDARGTLLRLGPDGSVDTSFARKLGPGFGGGVVRRLAQDGEGRVLVEGAFDAWPAPPHLPRGLVRIGPDGTNSMRPPPLERDLLPPRDLFFMPSAGGVELWSTFYGSEVLCAAGSIETLASEPRTLSSDELRRRLAPHCRAVGGEPVWAHGAGWVVPVVPGRLRLEAEPDYCADGKPFRLVADAPVAEGEALFWTTRPARRRENGFLAASHLRIEGKAPGRLPHAAGEVVLGLRYPGREPAELWLTSRRDGADQSLHGHALFLVAGGTVSRILETSDSETCGPEPIEVVGVLDFEEDGDLDILVRTPRGMIMLRKRGTGFKIVGWGTKPCTC